jgi:lactate dehydrogenase-like 2-hydroxyacid dehydrogenase
VDRPTVLMPRFPGELLVTGCEQRFEVIRLWESDDPEATLRDRGSEVRAVVTAAGIVIDRSLLGRLPRLQIIASRSVGYDTIDVDEANRRGIVVTHSLGVLDDEVADTAIALILMAVRQLPQAERHLRAGRWLDGPFPLSPTTTRGRRLGILGLGRIGERVAARGEAFGMSVSYHSRQPKERPYRYHPTLLALAAEVDTLVITVPGGAATRHLVGQDVLAALGPRGVLVNVARGSVVDEGALIDALQSGTILAAGLDVYEDEPRVPQALIDCDNAVLLPHVGTASVPTRDAMSEQCLDNLVSWFDGRGPLSPVPESRAVPPSR